MTLSGFHVFLRYSKYHCDFNPAALVNKALLLFLFRVEERLTATTIDKFLWEFGTQLFLVLIYNFPAVQDKLAGIHIFLFTSITGWTISLRSQASPHWISDCIVTYFFLCLELKAITLRLFHTNSTDFKYIWTKTRQCDTERPTLFCRHKKT